MGKPCNADDMPTGKAWKRLIGWRLGRRIVLCLALGTALVACFLAEEYWRGKRAWEKCKVETRGQRGSPGVGSPELTSD